MKRNATTANWSPLAIEPVGPLQSVVGRRTVAAMLIGQHVMAVLLSGIAVYRAVLDGVPVALAAAPAVLILLWNFFGMQLLQRVTSLRAAGVWWLVGFGALWLVAIVISPEYVWLAFLLWLLSGHLLPLWWGLGYSVLVFIAVVSAPLLHHSGTGYAYIIGPLVGGVFAFGVSRGYLQLLRDAAERERLVTSLTKAQRDLGALQEELAIAQRQAGAVDERTRIARDIHDTIAQSLSSITMLASSGQQHTTDAAAQRTLEQVETLARESLADVRRVLDALTPAELEAGALGVALQGMLARTHDQAGITAEAHIADSLPQLPAEVEVALLRITQSALANVRAHAQASRVVVSLIDDDDSVILDIIDDGRGFDLAAWRARTPDASGTASYGLRFMQQRVQQLGGTFDISSEPGRGTALSARIPIAATNAGAPSAAGQPSSAGLPEQPAGAEQPAHPEHPGQTE